ncbi:helix-hairpin-helix domain-containing protein [Hymenobacter sp. GOD-10R]|uniref:ComEA family DNA-binding protein n=1 Tax=Hymenobacter sp. GOD-10R TaxID=3093922 RepID=UPI002D779F9F|nr:helix-hairpin-helix domain-containing protein [Hymenobacter sp. GOD-10R]WRQ29612.1 helix-hairpin-helix domain-containing protein [Hymenobacter sp. GOD-10R]
MKVKQVRPYTPQSSFLTKSQTIIRRYFGFSRRETSGFVVLVTLLLLWLFVPALLRPALPHYDPAADQRQLNEVAAELAAQRQPRTFSDRRYPRRSYAARVPVAQVSLAPFDPNMLTPLDWEARGLPHFVAERIVHFRDVIGGFKAKEQIRRTYGLPDSVYARLAPYILLPDQLPSRTTRFSSSPDRFAGKFTARPSFPPSKFARKPAHLAAFDLNTADTTQLMQIRGIGRGISARIVAYRAQLGGFVRAEQMAEIYSLRDAPDLVDSLRKYTFVKASFAPASLDVNTASFDELQSHPYMGKRLARVVVAFRQQHGPFKQPDDLRQIRILDDATFEKLKPYLRF